MANSKRFHGKYTGAMARLFAYACEFYIRAAEDACDDTPVDFPIFSWLSPHQRLQLVHEVMVGLLCSDEPLPPETIQHYTTYRALVAFIWIQIGHEIDEFKCVEPVGEDLRAFCDNTTDNGREEQEKMDRAETGTDTRRVEAFQAPDELQPDYVGHVKKMSATISALLSGQPVSADTRRSHRPLTEMEEWAFRWRRLVDDALQENTNPNGLLGPLCNVDFDWRCTNREKWARATASLMVTYQKAVITRSESALVFGKIGEVDYADRSRHARIHAIEKIVKDLRDSYDPVWKADMLAIDERAIFAVCSSENYLVQAHRAWETAFAASCKEQGVDFSKCGDYQKRLEIYRRISPLYKEGLSRSYHNGFDHFEDAKAPANYERYDPTRVKCHADDCWLPKEALKLCSRCKIVSYCSKECQQKDWPDHKKHCKVLAELQKDKAKVSEIVKNF